MNTFRQLWLRPYG